MGSRPTESFGSKRNRQSPEQREKVRIKETEGKTAMENTSLNDIAQLLDLKLAPLKEDLNALLAEVGGIREENVRLKEEVSSLNAACNLLEARVEELEIRDRRNNLIFNGFSTSENEDLNQFILKVCKDMLKVDLSVETLNVYRFGNKQNLIRPLMVTFGSAIDRDKVWKAGKVLWKTDFSIQEDLPWAARRKKNKLLRLRREILKTNQNIKIRVRAQGLEVDNTRFTWSTKEGILYGEKPGISKLSEIVGSDMSECCSVLLQEESPKPGKVVSRGDRSKQIP